jgi:hypothetical protein
MYRAVVFNVANLQQFEGFKSDGGCVEASHQDPQEAALEAVAKAIGIVDCLDVYLVHDIIFAFDHPVGCVYQDEAKPILLLQSRRKDQAGIDAGWDAPGHPND